jgi:hypothetical protein
MNEATISYLEEHIPELADAATKQAYWQTLASGDSVVELENNQLVEVFPDGSRKVIKTMPPAVSVMRGQKMRLK